MSKYLDNNGLLYLWAKIKDYVATHGGAVENIAWDDITDKPDVALKSDIASVYKYKGSLVNYSSLPMEDNEIGDVWNVEATEMNYAWTGTDWDALGESFQIESITNAEIDAIVEG